MPQVLLSGSFDHSVVMVHYLSVLFGLSFDMVSTNAVTVLLRYLFKELNSILSRPVEGRKDIITYRF